MRESRSPVGREPSDRPDRRRRPNEAMGEPPLRALHEPPRQHRRDAHARQVVVRERGVADMRRDQHLLVALARNDELAEGKRAAVGAGHEIGVDHDLVGAEPGPLDRLAIVLGDAEAPFVAEEGGAVGHEVGLVAQGMEVGGECLPAHRFPHGHGTVHEMQRRARDVDDACAGAVRHVGVAQAPFGRHFPVEDGRAAHDLHRLDRHPAAEHPQGFANAFAALRAVEREQPGGHRVKLGADVLPHRHAQLCLR